MYKLFRPFLKFNYNPKVIFGTLIFNTSLSIFYDNKYGQVTYKSAPIVEGCNDTSHVFYGHSHITKYETDTSKLFFRVIPSSIFLSLLSIPMNIYFNQDNQDNQNNGCLCGKIK